MSKRFMVWDDEATDWICVPGTERDVWDLLDLLVHKSGLMKRKFHINFIKEKGRNMDITPAVVWEGEL